MIGRHLSDADQAKAARRRRLAGFMLIPAVGLGAAAAIVPLAIGSAPSVQANELPQPPKVTQPAEVAGPVQPIFDFADVQPWDPGKEPVAVVVSKATKIATSSRVPSRTPVARVPVAAEREPITSQTEPAPVVPPRDDPLHDDGTFGDGCEQPGTPPRCDPDVPPVGLPPVVVVETPPVDVAEEPPATPAEEEPPVNEVEVVEPTEEAAP